MRFEVYSKDGFCGFERSLLKAHRITKRIEGPFAILVKERKHSYPHTGISGKDGISYRATMLLYPPDAKCKQWKADEWLQNSLDTRYVTGRY